MLRLFLFFVGVYTVSGFVPVVASSVSGVSLPVNHKLSNYKTPAVRENARFTPRAAATSGSFVYQAQVEPLESDLMEDSRPGGSTPEGEWGMSAHVLTASAFVGAALAALYKMRKSKQSVYEEIGEVVDQHQTGAIDLSRVKGLPRGDFVLGIIDKQTKELLGLQMPKRSQMAMLATTGDMSEVPDMQKRNVMNALLVGAIGLPATSLVGGFAAFFVPASGGGDGGGIPAMDKNGNPITLKSWMAKHASGDRELVQGIKGDATWVVTTETGVENFGINAVCTHLGCVVPWNKAENKFMCPCHGSQYDKNGKVVRGPAPLSLALAHLNVKDDDKLEFTPWTETDFRTGLEPWWK